LWDERRAEIRQWLHNRGLRDHTIHESRLGFNPTDTRRFGLFVAAGIVIPWFEKQSIRMLQVRRLKGEPKYQAVAGSTRGGIYPTSDLRPGVPVLLCEGEFDCLLANQVLAASVNAVTIGSAGDKPTLETINSLLAAPKLLLAYDSDHAGEKAVAEWQITTTRARRICPPIGKDLTASYLAGVDLQEWIRQKLAII
jgi:DNA primase